jgi:hypothetical protein
MNKVEKADLILYDSMLATVLASELRLLGARERCIAPLVLIGYYYLCFVWLTSCAPSQ